MHYIRPIGSKCFAGELLHFRGSVFKAGDLRIPLFPAASSPSQTEMRQTCELFYRSKHRKGRSPVSGDGTLADNRPTLFDEAKREMINSQNRLLGQILAPLCISLLVLYFGHSADSSRSIRPRRGGRAAECGGLLNRCRGQNSYRGFESPPLRQKQNSQEKR